MTIRKKAGRISPVLMGDYDNTTVYRRLDWVKYGGTSYICKKNNTTGIVPSDPDRWQKIIDEANLNIPNHWQMTSRNGKGTIEQIGTTWIMTVPTMSEASDAATAYWGVKLAKETEYTIRYGMSNGADGDSMYVNVSDTQGSHYQFSRLENGDSIRFVKLPKDAWVWMKFQHYSNNTDNAYAYLILEPITMLEERRISFSAEHTRENISSTDTLRTIFGKIKKYFSDLKTVAFTGSYTDLSNKPVSLKNPNTLNIKFNGTSQTSYDGSATKEVNITPAGISAVNTSTVLTTKEQISANTNANNVTGALVTKALMSDINTINSKLSAKNPFSIALKRDYDYKTASGWKGLLSWNDNNGRTGYLQENVSDGKITLYLTNERGDILINGNSVAWIVNNINNLKSSRTWNVILAAQADGTHEIPALDGTEALLMLGYVYRIQATMTIPMNIFKTARGEGGKILFEGLTIEVVDDTHIKVTNLANDYLFRVFVR